MGCGACGVWAVAALREGGDREGDRLSEARVTAGALGDGWASLEQMGRPRWADKEKKKTEGEGELSGPKEKGNGLNLFEGSNKFESSSSLECGYLT